MRVALIEPSRTVQRIMADVVTRSGHQVLCACEGAQALDWIKSDTQIRTLLTPIHLPDMSGLSVCAHARRLASSRRPLYIVVMSSNTEYDLAVKALDQGADDFMRKPFYPEELSARLRTADRLTSMHSELIELASIDGLTKLLNRRAFFERANEACGTAAGGRPLSAVLFDIDHFKKVNDTCGHDTGDAVLVAVSAVAKSAAAIVGRLGGEEFCVLEHCDLEEGAELAEGLRRAIARLSFPSQDSITVTSSFGVAEWERGDTADLLLRRADVALYEAKRKGRNRVVAADTFALTDDHVLWRGTARTPPRSE
jgi:diguanylate cyclase (GGDEF)-like protein